MVSESNLTKNKNEMTLDKITKDLVPLQDWLDETGFTRPNFNVIKVFFEEGCEYHIIQSRYYINKERIRLRIIEIGGKWEALLKNS